MKNIYLVRHGESIANINKIFAGQFDAPLTELGKRQSQCVLNYFKDKDINEIYSSSLTRAVDTIKPTAEYFSLKINLDARLKEINGGDWEGKLYEEIREESYQFREVWKKDLVNCICDNGESVRECAKRVFDAFLDILKNSKSKNIIICSHAFAIRAILANALYQSVEDINKISFLVNAGISQIAYDGFNFIVKKMSIEEHLGDLITTLPNNV
jgi:broad specificity phosphatase PhoE